MLTYQPARTVHYANKSVTIGNRYCLPRIKHEIRIEHYRQLIRSQAERLCKYCKQRPSDSRGAGVTKTFDIHRVFKGQTMMVRMSEEVTSYRVDNEQKTNCILRAVRSCHWESSLRLS